jgi:hypothetical protein
MNGLFLESADGRYDGNPCEDCGKWRCVCNGGGCDVCGGPSGVCGCDGYESPQGDDGGDGDITGDDDGTAGVSEATKSRHLMLQKKSVMFQPVTKSNKKKSKPGSRAIRSKEKEGR